MAEQVVDIRERIERMRTQITDKPNQVDSNKNKIESSEKKPSVRQINDDKGSKTEARQSNEKSDSVIDEKSLETEIKHSNEKSTSVIEATYENIKNSNEIAEEKKFKKTIEKQPLEIPQSVENATNDFLSRHDQKKKKEYQSKTYKNYHVNNLVDENKNNINLEDKSQPFPQFSLNVNNPISWKLMLLIMLMQLMTNIMLVVVLYLK